MGYAAAFGVLTGAMLVFPQDAAAAAAQAMYLWARSVAPVLGPFMVCALMIVSRINGGFALRTALGWLSGSPGGAKMLRSIAPRGRAALRGAALTGTMSPMFFLGTVSAWLNDPAGGRLILLCHWLGALILGLLIPGGTPTAPGRSAPIPLGQALGDTAQTLLTVALCMALGSVAARMAACALPMLPPIALALMQCALEVTSGAQTVIGLQLPETIPLLCAVCSFGGFSLLMQNAVYWRSAGVSLGTLVGLRLLHALLSGGLCLAACAMGML